MANTVQLAEVIDNRKLTPFQMGLFALCALVLFFDGFDVQAIGFVAPAIIKDWSLPPGELGPVFSAGLFGLMLGALLIAPLADKVGRKPIILVSAALFGVFTLATAWAHSVASLLALRFLTGLGLGGCMPNAIALTSEYAPARQRAFLITMMFNGFSLGSLVGGVLAGQFIPTYGWRAVFIVGRALRSRRASWPWPARRGTRSPRSCESSTRAWPPTSPWRPRRSLAAACRWRSSSATARPRAPYCCGWCSSAAFWSST